MGVVYLVQAGKSLGALKLIRPQLADDEEFRARFRREVEAGRAVSGPYTARFIDAQLDGPAPYLVTEYVVGPSLAEAIAEGGPFSFEAVVGLASGLAQALRAIHATGVIHRDLKPSNILIGPTGPRIIDFGIARAMEGTSVTRTGMSVGSPSWMAPEAARGEPVSQATDVFAWACMVMYAATGRGPFGEGRPEAILYRIVHEAPDLSGLDARLVPVVRAALARDPGSRPSTSALIEALSEALAGGDPDPAEIGTAVRTRTDLLMAEDRPDITTPMAPSRPRRKRWAIAIVAIIGLARSAEQQSLRAASERTATRASWE
jgi:serine/threonine protein kinase